MTTGYDKISIDHQICMDIPFREATGILAMDRGKPNRAIALVNTPTWTSTAANLGVLDFNGATEYGECGALDTQDLDFTTGDYSIAVWVNWNDTATSEIVVARYELDVDGWEVYLFYTGVIGYLQLRHHHAGGAAIRTGCYSVGWIPDTGIWQLLGITRSGAYPLHYRDGVALDMVYDVGGLENPETCNQDLVIGVRYTKNTNYFEGQMQGLRIWDRELSAAEMMFIFERERKWFGV